MAEKVGGNAPDGRAVRLFVVLAILLAVRAFGNLLVLYSQWGRPRGWTFGERVDTGTGGVSWDADEPR